jgi:hypothetical protein
MVLTQCMGSQRYLIQERNITPHGLALGVWGRFLRSLENKRQKQQRARQEGERSKAVPALAREAYLTDTKRKTRSGSNVNDRRLKRKNL